MSRLYAWMCSLADQFGNLQGDDSADFFECELVLGTSSTSSAADNM
jgi:hypothetical protein